MLECDIYYVKKSRLKGIRSACVHAKLLQSCQTLYNRVDCSPPGFSVHGTLQARMLEWVAMPSSREISPTQGPNPRLMSPVLADRFFTTSVA